MKTLKLKGLMTVTGNNQATLAEKIGISRVSLSTKLNGKSVFTLPEVQKIVEVLQMSSVEVMQIFFSKEEG